MYLSRINIFNKLKSSVSIKILNYSQSSNLHKLLINMPKDAKHTVDLQRQRQKLKVKGQKYVPGTVTLHVLGSGAKGAPKSLYLFTDQSRSREDCIDLVRDYSGRSTLGHVIANAAINATSHRDAAKVDYSATAYAYSYTSISIDKRLNNRKNQEKYLFNCGEGSQRLAHEHKMKLSKLEHIFITHSTWDNIGGLPGVALTIQDVGVPEITVHGPAGTDELFSATRRFVVLKDLAVHMADCVEGGSFVDNVMTVHYVPICGKAQTEANSDHTTSDVSMGSSKVANGKRLSFLSDQEESEDDVDYYAHERSPKKRARSRSRDKKRHRSNSNSCGGTLSTPDPEARVTESVMCYVCQLKPRAGALCLERCVERGVPAGPLLGRLKSGEDVELPDGTLVMSADVCLPDDPGPVFIVVDCPSVDYLDRLVNHAVFTKHQATATSENDVAYLVVHFTPRVVMEDPRYRHWMDQFSPSTYHLVLNDSNSCTGSVAVHRIQHKLNLLHPIIFPLLQDKGIPIIELPSQRDVPSLTVPDDAPRNRSETLTLSGDEHAIACKTLPMKDTPVPTNRGTRGGNTDVSSSVSLTQGRTLTRFCLRPKRGLEMNGELTLSPKMFLEETLEEDGFPEKLSELKRELSAVEARGNPLQPFPQVLFLGTGSCIPNKTRNTSGILLRISADTSVLLDCGEGTYGQLVRFYGPAGVGDVLRAIRAVYVSHLHADHHIGLVGLLKGRKEALLSTKEQNHPPVFLMAPRQIMFWLNFYHRHFEPILQEFELVANGDLHMGAPVHDKETHKQLLDRLNMSDISTILVKHCPNAFGVAFTHKDGWKITYSGDTMPCNDLVKLGKGSDLLIHEATMEDELQKEARYKLHSTTSQAIQVGLDMEARFTLLTHFSQRYAKLPRFSENFSSKVGIAFDNMQVRFSDLPLLPLLYPALKLMFAEHYEELEQKAARRIMRMEREKAANSSS
uniref:Zinc phosphodiesterase ELAC protein 2 n=1 Tax=Timema shepardi TaxID=629360 RepID=A0A7R9AZ35_TIMSH|nr:unnamed protein product [Timema shepardi]